MDVFQVYVLNTEEYFSTQLKRNCSDFRSPVLFHSRKSSVVQLKFHLRLHPLALLWLCVCCVCVHVVKRSRKAVLTKTTTDENPPTARFMIRSCKTDKLERQFRKTYVIFYTVTVSFREWGCCEYQNHYWNLKNSNLKKLQTKTWSQPVPKAP